MVTLMDLRLWRRSKEGTFCRSSNRATGSSQARMVRPRSLESSVQRYSFECRNSVSPVRRDPNWCRRLTVQLSLPSANRLACCQSISISEDASLSTSLSATQKLANGNGCRLGMPIARMLAGRQIYRTLRQMEEETHWPAVDANRRMRD